MTELALNEHILVRKRCTRYCWMDFVRHAIIWVVSCVFITGNSHASATTVQDPVIAIHNADMEMNQGRYMEALSILQETIETFDNAGDSLDDCIKQRAYLLSGNIYLASLVDTNDLERLIHGVQNRRGMNVVYPINL